MRFDYQKEFSKFKDKIDQENHRIGFQISSFLIDSISIKKSFEIPKNGRNRNSSIIAYSSPFKSLSSLKIKMDVNEEVDSNLSDYDQFMKQMFLIFDRFYDGDRVQPNHTTDLGFLEETERASYLTAETIVQKKEDKWNLYVTILFYVLLALLLLIIMLIFFEKLFRSD